MLMQLFKRRRPGAWFELIPAAIQPHQLVLWRTLPHEDLLDQTRMDRSRLPMTKLPAEIRGPQIGWIGGRGPQFNGDCANFAPQVLAEAHERSLKVRLHLLPGSHTDLLAPAELQHCQRGQYGDQRRHGHPPEEAFFVKRLHQCSALDVAAREGKSRQRPAYLIIVA